MTIEGFDFTNWREHPTDNRYQIFFFKKKEESDHFENLLNENGYWFEKHFESEDPNNPYYFAVNKRDLKPIIQLNYLSIGAYRKPFIGSTILRTGLVIGMMIVMAIAIIGYLKAH